MYQIIIFNEIFEIFILDFTRVTPIDVVEVLTSIAQKIFTKMPICMATRNPEQIYYFKKENLIIKSSTVYSRDRSDKFNFSIMRAGH